MHVQLSLLYLRLKLPEQVEIENIMAAATVLCLPVTALRLPLVVHFFEIINWYGLNADTFFALFLAFIRDPHIRRVQFILKSNIRECVSFGLLPSAAAERLILVVVFHYVFGSEARLAT